MRQINGFIAKNFSKLFLIFLCLGPIIDIITGVMLGYFKIHFTIGMVIRFLFLLFCLYSSIFVFKKKKVLIYYGSCLAYIILYLLLTILTKDHSFWFLELQNVLKIFYFPLLLISLIVMKDKLKISYTTLAILFGVYLLGFFLPTIFNIGFKSYEITKYGSIGWFHSANEIGAILAILFPFFLLSFRHSKYLWLKVIGLLIYGYSVLTMGTKVPLLAIVFILFFGAIYFVIACIRQKKYNRIAILGSGIIVLTSILILIVPKTNFYKNIKVHLAFLEIDSIQELFSNVELIDHFVFSQRITFLSNRIIDYHHSSWPQKILGLGIYDEEGLTKSVEMDYYDVFLEQGIVGFILFILPLVSVLYTVFIKNIHNKLNFQQYIYRVVLLLILALSLFQGHVLTSPNVSIYAIVVLLLIKSKDIVENGKRSD